jgi:hypothetical protein
MFGFELRAAGLLTELLREAAGYLTDYLAEP